MLPEGFAGLAVLSAMITPALLISACGTLIFSTSTRLARIVDRVRALSHELEQHWTGEGAQLEEDKRAEVERQLASHAVRGRLIQGSLTSFYVSLGLFVATSIGIALVAFLPRLAWLPTALGIAGALMLFGGCVLLIRETRLALASVNAEMAFALGLRDRHRPRAQGAGNEG